MAQMGMTFVDGINEVVETILEFPMSGVIKPSDQSDLTSVYYRAEQFIDRENRRIQAWGWPENTRQSVAYTTTDGDGVLSASTPAGGGWVQFTTAGTVLKVRGAGPDSYRNLVLRKSSWVFDPGSGDVTYNSTFLYDADRSSFDVRKGANHGSTAAASTEEVHIDITEILDFEYLPSHLQDVIVARAKMTFQRRMQGNPQMDLTLNQEYMQAEASALRNKPETDQNFNIRPMLPASGGGAQGEGK